MDAPPRDHVIERIEALERENRRVWYVGIAVVCAAIILLVEGTSLIRPPRIVEAQGFVLKDPSGRVRGRLRTNREGSPEFSLLDESGEPRVNLKTTVDHEASLFLYDRGRARVELTATSEGSALFRLADDSEESQLALYLRSDGSTGQSLENGKEGYYVGVQSDGIAGLCLMNEQGEEYGRMGMLPDPLLCVRSSRMHFGSGPAPFRKRVNLPPGALSPIAPLSAKSDATGKVTSPNSRSKQAPHT